MQKSYRKGETMRKRNKDMNFSKTINLYNGWVLGGHCAQVGMSMKAFDLTPPTFLGRTERLRQRLIGLKLRSFGLNTSAVKKAEDQYERHLITRYIRHGGEVFYKTWKAPRGAKIQEKCKPYVRIENE